MPICSRNLFEHDDDFSILRRFRRAEGFDADLVELPEPSLLRPLVSEHRPGIEELLRRGKGMQIVLHITSYRAAPFLPAVSVTLRFALSGKVYISLPTMSEVSPMLRTKISVDSIMGSLIS